jgi:hypothetical protein
MSRQTARARVEARFRRLIAASAPRFPDKGDPQRNRTSPESEDDNSVGQRRKLSRLPARISSTPV